MGDKYETITVHLSAEQKLRFKKLTEGRGSTVSEKACALIMEYLEKEESDFRLLQEVFDFDGSKRV